VRGRRVCLVNCGKIDLDVEPRRSFTTAQEDGAAHFTIQYGRIERGEDDPLRGEIAYRHPRDWQVPLLGRAHRYTDRLQFWRSERRLRRNDAKQNFLEPHPTQNLQVRRQGKRITTDQAGKLREPGRQGPATTRKDDSEGPQ